MFPSDQDEGRHRAQPEPNWEESWQFDVAAADGSLGVTVRLALRDGGAWYWAHVAQPRHDLVAVRDHEVPPPRGRPLELRGTGIWAELTCETPLDHWSAGLEAFGVAFDDPAEAYGDERGQPMPVGLDLEWEAAGPCWPYSSTVSSDAGYAQPCTVHGEVLVGPERIEVDASGGRSHQWGVRDWWSDPWWQAHGRLEDGAAFWAAAGAGPSGGSGAWWSPTGGEPDSGPARLVVGENDRGLPSAAELTVAEAALKLTPAAHAPVIVPSPDGRSSRLWRALVRVSAGDGRRGSGWCEQVLLPQ